MSKLRVLPIDFQEQGGLKFPADSALFDAVQRFCSAHLAEKPNLSTLSKSWAAVRLDEEGKLEEVIGLIGYKMVPDICLFRATDKGGTVKLSQRINDFFSDQGIRGQEVFLHSATNETPEQRCADFEATMAVWDARPAERFKIVVR